MIPNEWKSTPVPVTDPVDEMETVPVPKALVGLHILVHEFMEVSVRSKAPKGFASVELYWQPVLSILKTAEEKRSSIRELAMKMKSTPGRN
jgi:hypothetical protein